LIGERNASIGFWNKIDWMPLKRQNLSKLSQQYQTPQKVISNQLKLQVL